MTTRADYAALVLAAFKDTVEHRQALVACMMREGSNAENNPMDTTQGAPGATDYNSVGVKNFPTLAEGVATAVATLTNGYYRDIVSLLDDECATAEQIVGSPEWATWGTWQSPQEALADLAVVKAQWPNGPASAVVAGSDPTTPTVPTPPSPVPSILEELFMPTDNGLFVRWAYRECLCREADEAGYTANVNALNAGEISREQVFANLQDSPEGQAVIAGQRRAFGLP